MSRTYEVEIQVVKSIDVFATDPLPIFDPAATLFTFIPYMFYWDAIPGISSGANFPPFDF